jgi:hypothetical protein
VKTARFGSLCVTHLVFPVTHAGDAGRSSWHQ